MPYQVLLYYWFTDLRDFAEAAVEHRELCEQLGLVGRVLLAPEGVNGTVSGTPAACAEYMEVVSADPRFAGIEFKVDDVEAVAFKKLIVKARPEMITLGRDLEIPVHERTGIHLSPVEWLEMLDDPDVLVVDGRNDYEWELGRFQNAICPPVESFRDLPEWLLLNRAIFEGKKILTYCTGGIRCEKLSAWMLQEGFEDVYQLHGGIVQYGKDPATLGEKFEGINVVFDDRIAVPAGPSATIITKCRECGTTSANYVNCANVLCNLRMILCEGCEVTTGRCCSEACRTAPAKREKGKKLSESTTDSLK